MTFKVGDKVKFTKIVLEKMLRYNHSLRKMKNAGEVICEGCPYMKVSFGDHIWWISGGSLEPIVKNQQLLFEFME